MRRRVVFSPRAEGHVASIYETIALGSGEERADIVIGRLVAACLELDLFPERGTRRDDLMPGLRVIGHRRWATIAFAVEPDRVVVHAVLARGRDLNALFDEPEE